MTQDNSDMELITNKTLAFVSALESEEINRSDFLADPIKTLFEFGITIPDANKAPLTSALKVISPKLESSVDNVGESWACWGCRTALTINIAALEIITIVAIAAAAAFFFPEVAGPVIIAFLENKLAVEITAILLLGTAAIAAEYLCEEFGPC